MCDDEQVGWRRRRGVCDEQVGWRGGGRGRCILADTNSYYTHECYNHVMPEHAMCTRWQRFA